MRREPTKIALQTRLAPYECKARLASAVDTQRFAFTRSGCAGSKPIIGRFREETFRLQKRRSYRNSFAPLFYGRYTPCGGGTLIEGQFKIHPLTRAFMFYWFGFLSVFALLTTILPSKGDPEVPWGRAIFLLGEVAMAAFGIGLLKFCRWLARNEPAEILELLQNTLEAHEVTPSSPIKN
jgi:hypothetical protein